jgi:hypothetical protein
MLILRFFVSANCKWWQVWAKKNIAIHGIHAINHQVMPPFDLPQHLNILSSLLYAVRVLERIFPRSMKKFFCKIFFLRAMSHPLSAMFAEEKLMEARQEHVFR